MGAESLHQSIQNKDVNLVIIDTRPFSEYLLGHIPGSVNMDLMNFHWFDTSQEGIIHFERQMVIMLKYLGIDKSSSVVFYDNISGPSASRGVWLLHYFSHYHVYILNGGFQNWIKLNLPIQTKTNHFSRSDDVFDVDKEVLADLEYVQKRTKSNSDDVIIIDCRSELEYNGIIVRAYKGGHIPNSINIDWVRNLENGKFRSLEKLDDLYSFIRKDVEIITYCHGGYRAANTYLVLKSLGYSKVKMYLGSWGEWGNNPNLPIE